MTASLMIQGTGSDVGKSLVVAGLARAYRKRGLSVAPFKPQNMSNNAAVTAGGGEIGRAQALQARACGLAPHVDMNPVLLKPESGTGAQVVVRGERVATLSARDYMRERTRFLPAVLESYRRLRPAHDLVLVEGAGSPAEINLRAGDIANMGFAEAARVPVVLVGDIHRGGVIASLVGTMAVIPPDDAALVQAFLVNKFHGDPSLFDDGISFIEARTGWPCAGVIPHFDGAAKLPAEDALALEKAVPHGGGTTLIAVPRLARIANFDDLDPLRLEPGICLEIVQPGRCIPAEATLVLLPGSKATIADLALVRDQGWDIDIAAHIRRGGRVIGVCGGYQMLGTRIADPDGIEGPAGSVAGLGHLDVETVLTPKKTLSAASAVHVASSEAIEGYEMHIGVTDGPDRTRPFAQIGVRDEGARNPTGRVEGTYLHGLFAKDAFRRRYLADLGAEVGTQSYDAVVEATLDELAAHLERAVDLDLLLSIARGETRCARRAAE